jgi:hypothetical protein
MSRRSDNRWIIRPEGQAAVILSNAIWQSRFDGDPNIIGKIVALDATPNVIVGVLPAAARFSFVGRPTPVSRWVDI